MLVRYTLPYDSYSNLSTFFTTFLYPAHLYTAPVHQHRTAAIASVLLHKALLSHPAILTFSLRYRAMRMAAVLLSLAPVLVQRFCASLGKQNVTNLNDCDDVFICIFTLHVDVVILRSFLLKLLTSTYVLKYSLLPLIVYHINLVNLVTGPHMVLICHYEYLE